MTYLNNGDNNITKQNGEKKMQPKPKNHWIFDFDGVIGDTFSICIKTDMLMTGDTFEVARQRQTEMFMVNFLTHKHERHNLDTDQFIVEFCKLAKEDAKGFDTFIKCLKTIFDEGDSRYAIVSSGSKDYILPILNRAGIASCFDYILCRQDGKSKVDKVNRVINGWGAKPNEVKFFADTINDVIELSPIIGLENIFGCAWGFHGRELLAKVVLNANILLEQEDVLKINL